MAKAVLIQPSFYESMKVLPDDERLLLYDSICEYSLHGKKPKKLSPTATSLFILMKPNIDSSNKRYAASTENGKKGGAPKGNQNARKQPKNNQTEQPKNNQDYDYDFDLEKDCDKDNIADKPPRPRFVPPTVEEVREYCVSRNNSVDPERFIAFYSSKGWMVGKNKMKDWKAAVHSWERNEYKKSTEVMNGRTKADNQEPEWNVPNQLVF